MDSFGAAVQGPGQADAVKLISWSQEKKGVHSNKIAGLDRRSDSASRFRLYNAAKTRRAFTTLQCSRLCRYIHEEPPVSHSLSPVGVAFFDGIAVREAPGK